jgi:hypothetical protein
MDGLLFLCAVACFLAVEAVTRKSAAGPGLMQIVYWCLVVVQSLIGVVLVIVVGVWFLLSEMLPWWLRLFAPEQWRVWQNKLAARGGPASRFYLFTFGCYFFGGLAMLLPAARMLLASGG